MQMLNQQPATSAGFFTSHKGAKHLSDSVISDGFIMAPFSRKPMLRYQRVLLVLAVAAIASVQAHAAYKCKDAQGRVSFQDSPCDGASQSEKLQLPPPQSAENAAAAQQELVKLKRSNQMSEAIRKHIPLVGMTRTQLDEAMGPPHTTNASEYQGVGKRDQLIYRTPGNTWYVYVSDGIVTGVQQRPAQSAQPTASRNCPSQHRIREMEVSASSIMLTPPERKAMREKIDEAKLCR